MLCPRTQASPSKIEGMEWMNLLLKIEGGVRIIPKRSVWRQVRPYMKLKAGSLLYWLLSGKNSSYKLVESSHWNNLPFLYWLLPAITEEKKLDEKSIKKALS